ncbi:MAG: SusC/RagA family TonB-linked outer membrane protein [Bacteroidaceae bacterium]|nr:SusC/RagA family TonB-linked outer membrane protein [Bacteroidaceae bacterium]
MRKFLLTMTAILCFGFAVAQNVQVTGIATAADDGSPMPAVTVSVEGTSIGTTTDLEGAYSISAPSNGSLVFSFMGYESKTVPVNGRRVINVTLNPGSIEVDEVLITAVGIQRSERSLGYTVTKVNADEAVMKAEPDMLRALDGKVAGVQISAPSGDAGSATRITIRGNSSFLGNNQPLYVVDGVPYSNDGTSASGRASGNGGAFGSGISTLDPNDIESMSVLKGAAAAVLYGSRAANGVILITTKSGSKKANAKNGFSVNINSSYAIESIASLPDYQNSYGQGSDFNIAGSNGSWGAAFEEGMTIPMYAAIAAEYPDLALEMYPDLMGEVPYKAYPNNVKDLFQKGHVFDLSANVQKVTDEGNFNMTISRTDQDSYIPGSEFDRYSFSVGGNQKFGKKFRAGGNLAYSYTDQLSPMYGNNQSSATDGGMNSLARAFIMPRSWDIQNYPYQKQDGSNLLFQLSSQANNPYWAWENDKISTTQKRIVANANFSYEFYKWLTLDYTVGVNEYMMTRKSIVNLGSRGYAGNGHISKGQSSDQEIESTLLLTFNKRFQDLGVRATLGHNYNQDTYESMSASGSDIINPKIYNLSNTKGQTASESYSRTRKWGVFADILLDYKQWAFLNISGRNDVSSTLPKANNSFFYPAVSASVVFTDALGISDSFLNFGKFRAGWAKVGNDASPYYNNGFFVVGSPYMGQGMMELPTTLYDPELEPEFTSEFETGFELKFFESRIGLDFTYYNRLSENQIGAKTSAPSTGYSSYVTNFGSIRNKGLELGVDLYPVMTKDFTWSMYLTYTKNKSEVVELADGVDEIVIGGDFSAPQAVLIKGQPYGVLKGEKLARTEDGIPLVDPATGMYINDTEMGVIGDPNPEFKTALTNTLRYKDLSLSFMFDYQKGGCVFSSYLTDLLGRGVTKDTEDRLGTRIIKGVYGDANTLEPILDGNEQYIWNTTAISEADLWFSDGTYSTYAINSCDEVATYDATVWRLREVTLAYSLPKNFIKKLRLANAEVSVVGRNLWFFAPNVPRHTNYDPIVNTFGNTNVQGIDYTGAPSTRRVAFNLSLTF